MGTPIEINPGWVIADGLRIRSTPDSSSPHNIVGELAKGTQITVIEDRSVTDATGLAWSIIYAPGRIVGWSASQYISATPPIIVPPTPLISRHSVGLHCLEDAGPVVMAYVGQLVKAGFRLPCATVVNNFDLAAWLADGRAGYVVFRSGVGDPRFPDQLSPPTGVDAVAYGRSVVVSRFAQLAALGKLPPANIYLQFGNEMTIRPWHSDFFLGVMAECRAHGFHAAIGGYAVAQPEPDEWKMLAPALVDAKAHGDIVVLHTGTKYTNPPALPGQLSLPQDQPFWELRFPRLWEAVDPLARPLLIQGEFASGQNGQFPGIAPEISLIEKYDAVVRQYPYVIGFDPFTDGQWGGWGGADIDPALPELFRFVTS